MRGPKENYKTMGIKSVLSDDKKAIMVCTFRFADNVPLQEIDLENPVSPSDPEYVHTAFLKLITDKLTTALHEFGTFPNELLLRNYFFWSTLKNTLAEYKSEVKKYASAEKQTYIDTLLSKKLYTLTQIERARNEPSNIILQLEAILAKLQYQAALYEARISGKDDKGSTLNIFGMNYPVEAKETAAKKMIVAVSSYISNTEMLLTDNDLARFGEAASNGELNKILNQLIALKAEYATFSRDDYSELGNAVKYLPLIRDTMKKETTHDRTIGDDFQGKQGELHIERNQYFDEKALTPPKNFNISDNERAESKTAYFNFWNNQGKIDHVNLWRETVLQKTNGTPNPIREVEILDDNELTARLKLI